VSDTMGASTGSNAFEALAHNAVKKYLQDTNAPDYAQVVAKNIWQPLQSQDQATPVVQQMQEMTPVMPPAILQHVQQMVSGGIPGGGINTGNLTADERFVISREDASMNPDAYNSTLVPGMGHAFGIGQLTDVIRNEQAKKFGFNPNTTDPNQQIQMMRGYIADRYGNAANAAAHERQYGWY